MSVQEILEIACRYSTAMADAMLEACAETGAEVPKRERRDPFVILGDEWNEYQRRAVEDR